MKFILLKERAEVALNTRNIQQNQLGSNVSMPELSMKNTLFMHLWSPFRLIGIMFGISNIYLIYFGKNYTFKAAFLATLMF